MNKCRICLKHENILHSLHELDESRRISFSEMIIYIANIKNVTSEEHNKICPSCKIKATETYDFKMLIERSDMILNDINPKKQIKFCNINDIKDKVDIYNIKEEVDSKVSLHLDIMKECNNGRTCATYNNTTITKINSESKQENEELPVPDFLQSIKMEIKNEDCAYNSDVESCGPNSDRDDDDYIPCKPFKNNYKKKRKATEIHAMKGEVVCNVGIKPVYLKDVRVLYQTKCQDPQEIENKKHISKLKYYRNKKKEICCYCGKLTKSLKVHELVHIGERKYKCDLCQKTYLTENQLKNHKKVHANIRNYKCDICVATCLSERDLLRHKQMHSNILSYHCDVCSKGFKRKNALMRHIRTHNLKNKNVKCDLCSMMFYTKPALRHHMRVHTGERPYKCEICSQPYSYKRDFNRHCLKKHGVFINRRSVNVMNEEVLQRERALINELLLRKQGLIKDDQPPNPFEGPQSALAFEQAMQILENRSIFEDF